MNILYASGFGDIEFDVLKGIAGENNFEKYIKITSDNAEKKISELKFSTSVKGSVLTERIVLFETDDNRHAINFINSFKSLKVPSAIFAVVTEHSRSWTFRELAGHLLKEHEQMLSKKPSQNNK